MPLGIDPKVDFAFKLVFGSPDHTRITISQSPEDRQYYEARMKFLRDQADGFSAAREEGREEGILAGKIQLLQELLEEEVTSKYDLLQRGRDELSKMLVGLQQRLRSG